MNSRSPSRLPAAELATDAPEGPQARAVAVFMDSLARSPCPRPRAVDPALLIRRAPLVDALADLRARERRVLVPALALEIVTFAAAAAVGLQLFVSLAPLGHLRGALELAARLAWAPLGLSLIVVALPLLWWIAEAGRASRRVGR
jgi:hypothetical protein